MPPFVYNQTLVQPASLRTDPDSLEIISKSERKSKKLRPVGLVNDLISNFALKYLHLAEDVKLWGSNTPIHTLVFDGVEFEVEAPRGMVMLLTRPWLPMGSLEYCVIPRILRVDECSVVADQATCEIKWTMSMLMVCKTPPVLHDCMSPRQNPRLPVVPWCPDDASSKGKVPEG